MIKCSLSKSIFSNNKHTNSIQQNIGDTFCLNYSDIFTMVKKSLLLTKEDVAHNTNCSFSDLKNWKNKIFNQHSPDNNQPLNADQFLSDSFENILPVQDRMMTCQPDQIIYIDELEKKKEQLFINNVLNEDETESKKEE